MVSRSFVNDGFLPFSVSHSVVRKYFVQAYPKLLMRKFILIKFKTMFPKHNNVELRGIETGSSVF